jgi:hypothetical protein
MPHGRCRVLVAPKVKAAAVLSRSSRLPFFGRTVPNLIDGTGSLVGMHL